MIEKRRSDDIQSARPAGGRDAAAARPAVPIVPFLPIGKSEEIGYVLAELRVRVEDRSSDDYAAFLEELRIDCLVSRLSNVALIPGKRTPHGYDQLRAAIWVCHGYLLRLIADGKADEAIKWPTGSSIWR